MDGRAHDVQELANLLLDQARILDGELPTDPAEFTKRLNELILRGLKARK